MSALPMHPANLAPALARLAQLQSTSLDRLALEDAVGRAVAAAPNTPQGQLSLVARLLGVKSPRWIDRPDPGQVPALMWADAGERLGRWGVLRGQNALGQWIADWWDGNTNQWRECIQDTLTQHQVAMLKLAKPYVASNSSVYQLIRQEVLSHRTVLRDALAGSLVINIIALTTSFYSMQIYDRVIPTGAMQTLLVLTLGVLAAVFFEWLTKCVRSSLYDRLIEQVDQKLARTLYMRFLAVRLDQLPQSVGSLAGQMRGYEAVRGFLTSATTQIVIDAPFALLFTVVIWLLAGPVVIIPLFFFGVCVALGTFYRRRIDALATQAMAAGYLKTGLLVESIEGAETIKSGQGGWRMLTKWMKTTDEARDSELEMRRISEHCQHLTVAFQQASYVLLVAAGALLVSRAELTMGALIACTILSGRVLMPVAMIPQQLLQWANAKAALQGLDRLWALPNDHDGQAQPVVVQRLQGGYRCESVLASYGANKALALPDFSFKPGEKIGVLGPIGSGKTTLLRLLSGMYKPQQGRILLDDMDLAHLAKPVLAEHVGYLQQEGRLFSGTLRDNLILGQVDPGDETIFQAARQTGLLQAVITAHPNGLHQTIFEGGSGLSGGQRQLVNLTRIFLRQPTVWLLDEPTAAMDRNTELQVIQSLRHAIAPSHSVVLVTHKPEMLDLVDRLIVIAGHQIVMDGPKALVMQNLQNRQPKLQQMS